MNTAWIKYLFLCAAGAVLLGAPPALRAQTQKMAIPAYFYPGADWSQAEASSPTVRIMIMNPNSGPGDKVNPDYVAQVKVAQAHGVKVIGYVHTSYGKRAFSVVSAETRDYFSWYHVDGVFYDEAASGAAELPYYRQCYDLTKSLLHGALVVLNPGTDVDQGYMQVSDVICTFESDYDDYKNKYEAAGWVGSYPASRFWHIVLDVPTDEDMQAVVALTKKRHAGWVYVTSVTSPNPYAALPPDPYWTDEVSVLHNP